MKEHSNQLKQELKKMGKQIDCFITCEGVTLHDELFSVAPMFEANLLKSVMKQLNIESSIDIPLGKIVDFHLGILVNGNFEYVNYGNYIVYSSEKQEDKGTYKIICYDKMLYAMKPYEEITGSYPKTIKTFLNNIAEKIGLTVKNTNFSNYSLQIETDLYKGLGYTYRDVLDEIAEATGSIIVINEDDQLEIKYPSSSGDTINEEYLKDVNVNFGEKYRTNKFSCFVKVR